LTRGARPLAAAFALAALCQCGGEGDAATGTSSAAIVGGVEVNDPTSPVLLLRGPQGFCSATLIAPNLLVTARHCVATLTPGAVQCTASGDLVMGTSGGSLALNDDPPSQLGVYTSNHVSAAFAQDPPDATASQILSTKTPSTCRDDIAFIVLTQPLAGITPVPVRINSGTPLDENAAVWGYGLTDEAQSTSALRTRSDIQIVGIGPDLPMTVPQGAPLRAVRIGPGSLTCNGDSGGPILAKSTGALVAVVSFGVEDIGNGSCPDSTQANTTGPRLAEYTDLALRAFAAAGAEPILEPGETLEAGVDADAVDATNGMPGDATVAPGDAEPLSPDVLPAAAGGASCTVGTPGQKESRSSGKGPFLITSLAMAAHAIGRRRR
jgi:hypothetical protein